MFIQFAFILHPSIFNINLKRENKIFVTLDSDTNNSTDKSISARKDENKFLFKNRKTLMKIPNINS